ncbi:mitochondrial import inner membrane translocase subunit tim54 [Coemansia sp. RSA 1722]|nr:mitochondrial import inner membrane translocase subunit tim54 [Coemansia sp. RSA 486]KAJ2227980.1 mitochondrial import inner membrane translocase subunit tim54 [Coemansia sp. RSA 485]KAJ2590369.1 mitochondrial import inner membrane translocase subunit tim54 [Coemansia sp. RSA 1722]
MSSGILGAIRKKLPSRNVSLFWGSVFGVVGFYRYNNSESQKRLSHYCKQAENVAMQANGALDTVRKVQVYIAVPMGELGTRKARLHWETYILPVFAAGALDYELTLVNDIETKDNGEEVVVRGGVHSRVAEEIKERRRKQLENEPDNEELRLWRQAIEERKRENEVREYKNLMGREPEEAHFGLWKPEPYPGVMDVVAIGRESWVEVINGINEGATGSINYTMPALVSLDAEERESAERKISTETRAQGTESEVLVTDTAGTPTQMATAPEAPEEAAHTINYDRFDAHKDSSLPDLPAVAYISHLNLTGWGSVPSKIWNFFHDQQNVDRYASQALQVVFESNRRAARGMQEIVDMGKAEEELPSWEGEHMDVVVDKRVADAMMVYETHPDDASPHIEPGEKAANQ